MFKIYRIIDEIMVHRVVAHLNIRTGDDISKIDGLPIAGARIDILCICHAVSLLSTGFDRIILPVFKSSFHIQNRTDIISKIRI